MDEEDDKSEDQVNNSRTVSMPSEYMKESVQGNKLKVELLELKSSANDTKQPLLIKQNTTTSYKPLSTRSKRTINQKIKRDLEAT